jgi:hypothetical protein
MFYNRFISVQKKNKVQKLTGQPTHAMEEWAAGYARNFLQAGSTV